MTVTLLSMFFYMDGWVANAARGITEIHQNIADGFRSPSVRDQLGALLGMVFLPLLAIAYGLGPLLLPFTKADLRILCALVILVNAAIICYGNIRIEEAERTLFNDILALYFFVWFFYVIIILRSRDLESMMTNEQFKAAICCVAAAASGLSVFIAIRYLSFNWVEAYSLSVLLVSMLSGFAEILYGGERRARRSRLTR